VVPLDISGIIFRSPYLYDRKAVFHRYEHKYNFLKDGVKYIVRTHRKKLNISLVNGWENEESSECKSELEILDDQTKRSFESYFS